MGERSLCMREVPGSIPGFSKTKIFQTMLTTFSSFLSFCSSLFLVYLLIKRGWCVNTSCTKSLYYISSTFYWHYNKGSCGSAEKGEDDDFGVSDDSSDAKERRFMNCHTSFFTKVSPFKNSGPAVT